MSGWGDIAVRSNEPPGGALDPLRERMEQIYEPLIHRQRELLDAAARVPEMLDDDTAQRAGDLARQVRSCLRSLLAAHRAEKEPFKQKCDVADAWRDDHCADLSQLLKTIRLRMEAYQYRKAEEERERHRAEAERKRAEAEVLRQAGLPVGAAEAERAAAEAIEHSQAKIAELVRMPTPMAGVVTARDTLTPEIIDKILACAALAELIDNDALLKAARLWRKQHGVDRLRRKIERNEQPLAGVRFRLKTSAEFR